MDAPPASFAVVRTPAFQSLLEGYKKSHRHLEADLTWLVDKLKLSPEMMGERVPQLQKLAQPVFKTRCKDSCCQIGQSGGWRIYYAVGKEAHKIWLLFLHHKREYENPRLDFLVQKLERAFESDLGES